VLPLPPTHTHKHTHPSLKPEQNIYLPPPRKMFHNCERLIEKIKKSLSILKRGAFILKICQGLECRCVQNVGGSISALYPPERIKRFELLMCFCFEGEKAARKKAQCSVLSFCFEGQQQNLHDESEVWRFRKENTRYYFLDRLYCRSHTLR